MTENKFLSRYFAYPFLFNLEESDEKNEGSQRDGKEREKR